jgi:hypothetical protein
MSSSSGRPSYIHNVFLNFRGEDTRDRLISHLYAALSNAGINTFLDAMNLKMGDKLTEILNAIELSRISIIVFSKGYTQSSWCLTELVKIMECHIDGQVVIPLFYDVDPSVVRHQNGDFGKALIANANQQYLQKDLLSNWKNALIKAANLTGWDANKFRYIL